MQAQQADAEKSIARASLKLDQDQDQNCSDPGLMLLENRKLKATISALNQKIAVFEDTQDIIDGLKRQNAQIKDKNEHLQNEIYQLKQ